ncbi:sensor histidine kinase [Siphonobacter sp. SORGH_AS_1065]|uniref:sensor histidine kinase n=1 Tax=Siphonobacter sp. SORGH_AS_1065 TaxID=3041795 RepID=UPI002787BEAC|nr:histidine kinase [Siphonobacter sp. SORGH_AS_1065]MDQ1090064.1 hypothetical protein [Siphonobacter sp. SORGH_AS_1065]
MSIQKIKGYPSKLDFCLYLGLLQWIAIIRALDEGGSWVTYSRSAFILFISHLPILLVTWRIAPWKRKQQAHRHNQIIYFGLYLLLLAFGSLLLLETHNELWEIVFTGAVCSLCLHLLLLVNDYMTKWVLSTVWGQKLSLEKSVFISITFIALMLSAMAVSSLGLPQYDTKQQLLIGFEFNLVKVALRFPTFLSYAGQLMLMYLCGYFFFLVNSRLLVGKILKERGVLMYILSALALVGITYPIMGQLLYMLPFSKRLGGIFSGNAFVWENAFGAITILLLSLPVLLAVQWSKQNATLVLLEKEKTRAELDLLKQQLNPHFFFNTLNNLYALSLQQSQHTPEVVLQLSDLMRYVIYKAREPYVEIGDEVQYLHDYLQLQAIRLKDKFDLQFNVVIDNPAFKIAPLLLIVLIENAFKHGIEPASGRGLLHMTLRIDSGKLYFTSENSFSSEVKSGTGIGLINLRKRLNLLYPDAHHLEFQIQNTIFKAELELENADYKLPNR